ncbi:MAG: class I adenylate-forming enzyme family protein [Paraburkholderia sp.]|jgi:long-chain acyl-CoA synthetase|uniref:class I adenylate-forming enzyme family protein n=1 Tax=Burkholderiaceae TaxID=119060 RepID=UPI0010F4F782|nr:class I adenylate-forming enzyme family protein [Burkholderia sp. 4M9327F10]
MHIADVDHLITETSSVALPGGEEVALEPLLAGLRAHALPEGAVVLVCMPNGRNLLRLFFALVEAGYVPAMLSPTTPVLRLSQMAEDFHAMAVVKPRLGEELRRELRIDAVNRHAGVEIGFFRAGTRPVTEPGEVVLTTSGTSSDFSSGCVHSIDSLRANARKHAADIGLCAADTVLVNLPLYYSFALVAQAIASIECGARLVISGPPFIGSRYIADLACHRVTVSSVTPVLMRTLLAHASTELPASVRALTVGGDFLAPEHAAAFVQRYPGKELYLTYGVTEAGPRVSTGRAHESDARRLASVGRPMQGTLVRLLEVDGAAREGELLVHSDTLLRRKIGRNAQNPLVEMDGHTWLKTGDIFEIDEDGYLFFKHRRSDFIVLNDEKVNLAAIKQFCRALPGVLTCRTRSIRHADTVNGYFLEVTVDDLLVGPAEADAMKAEIMKGLKHIERPSTLTLTPVNRQQYEFYK